jgi:circadian clock protein KaiC
VQQSAVAKKGAGIEKAHTGISGFDDITFGGLPRGRTSLVCGSAGCGKTLFGMEFLIRGAVQFDEPGVFITFEEPAAELIANVSSLGFDVQELINTNKFRIDYIHLDPAEIHEAGDFDLSGLFVRLALAIDSIGAKRVVLDTIEALFAGFTNQALLRAELRRLFGWLKERGLTAVITGERGDGQLTRQGLEEYVSDCVILLDHRVIDQVSTRRLRIVKYRGTTHGTNEYPFLIGKKGFSVLPITTLAFEHSASNERISSGIERLDSMLGGEGFFRGSSVLVTGSAGTGKTSVAASFANAVCERGEKVLYFALEESATQIARNMRSIGLDLSKWVQKGLLMFHANRPTAYGLEMHLATMHQLIEEFQPNLVVVDPITNFATSSTRREAHAMLLRLADYLKVQGITAFFTALAGSNLQIESSDTDISSMIDTWILLRDIELAGERNRGIYVLKARGTAHSNQIREFIISSSCIKIVDVYVGPEGVLTGSMRLIQEAKEKQLETDRVHAISARKRELARKQAALKAQIAALQADLSSTEEEQKLNLNDEDRYTKTLSDSRARLAESRRADKSSVKPQSQGVQQ